MVSGGLFLIAGATRAAGVIGPGFDAHICVLRISAGRRTGKRPWSGHEHSGEEHRYDA